MHRNLATHVSVLLAGLGLGVGAVAVAQPAPVARSSSAADSRIVKELRDINKSLVILNKSVGGYQFVPASNSLEGLLGDIKSNTSGTR
jgi:hypothetical protein